MAAGDVPTLPREIAPGVFWLGGCLPRNYRGADVHAAFFTYLVVGERATVLVDTGHPSHWDAVRTQLDTVLGPRPLDLVFPTHPELQHAGNLGRLLDRYPRAKAIGDLRDFHLHFPALAGRLQRVRPGDAVDLGGSRLLFLDAVLRDLPNTLWAYDTARQVLFVADGLSYLHHHAAGECAMLVEELPADPEPELVTYYNETAFLWTAHVDAGPVFDRLDGLLAERPVGLVAPAHGNVIGRLDRVLPVIRAATVAAHRGGR